MDYITCSRKKSRPRTDVRVCEKCPRKSSCADYHAYVQPSLFAKEDSNGLRESKTRRKAKRPKQEPERVQEQIRLVF